MKKLLTLSLLSTKLGFLLCFGLMGSAFGAELVFAETPPCHLEVGVADSSGDCDACELSKEAWSQDFVVTDTDITLEDNVDVLPVAFEDLFNQEQVIIARLSDPDPPDDIAVMHSHLVLQQGIVLVI